MAAPTVTSVTPSTGTYAGGTTVLIVGTNFSAATAVTIGGQSADFEISSATLLAATTPAHGAGAATVAVTNADGTSADAVSFTYTGAPGLFSVAEARAFDKTQLASATTYPDATITAAEVQINAEFADILGYYPISTVTTAELYDGDGSTSLLLVRPEVTAVSAITDTNTAGTVTTYDSDDLSDLAIYPRGELVRRSRGVFTSGHRNISVTYTSGLATLPGDLKQAALMVCVRRLCATDVPWESTGGTYEGINWTVTIDPSRNRWYGNDKVDGPLQRLRRVLPGIA